MKENYTTPGYWQPPAAASPGYQFAGEVAGSHAHYFPGLGGCGPEDTKYLPSESFAAELSDCLAKAEHGAAAWADQQVFYLPEHESSFTFL